ncbi:aminotransferase class I/II-fold pyridoxal phosphate-dependent enzyme [Pseudomonas guariconensis]|uniref:aminotransferase class I/II-fold pyridoxal phosphate-dependent enzyme n=1 Tax=Pseudomonas guariconensis TaxID=1288410 RepID=UPI0018A8A80B|nr:aminotransferase class I/II-fold pyridoxal phosphate-dependent enzyme [Pseudomonas guariconensis]MBF8723847.1 GntR family transcriptional regulator [Pseudomonas guariconensis]
MGRCGRGEFAYQAVCRYIEALINQADPSEEGRLPSLRDLAARLKVSLATVQNAYSLLEHQGRVRSVPKSGYFVAFEAREREQSAAPRPRPAFALPMATPMGLERALLAQERRLSRQTGASSWRSGEGALLRHVLAARYTRSSGHSWNAEHVHLATDVQALLEALLRALRLQGATAVVATPCCRRLLQALRWAGMRVLEVPAGNDSALDLERLAQVLAREPVALVVLPSCLATPLGRRVSYCDQQAMARLLADHPAWLLENDLDSAHCFGEAPAMHLRDGVDIRRLLVLGSLEATLGAEGPYAYLLCRQMGVEEAIARRGFLIPPLRQQAIALVCAKGEVEAWLPRLRSELQAHMEHLFLQVELCLGDRVVAAKPEGGRGIWGRLTQPANLDEAQAVLAGTGLTITPGERFSLQGNHVGYVALTWQGAPREGLEPLLQRLGRALAQPFADDAPG